MNAYRIFKVEFEVANQTLAEQQAIYDLLMKNLSFEQKESLSIVVTDYVGGKHYRDKGFGIRPDGAKCDECNWIDCETCSKMDRRKENFLRARGEK